MPFVPDQPAAAPRGHFVPDAAPAPAAPQKPVGVPGQGLAETGMTMLSSGAAMPAAGVAGLVASLFGGPEAGSEVVHRVSDALTYQPRTQEGDRYLAAASTPFEALHSVGTGAGERVTDATGSPALGAAVQTGVEGVLPILIPGAVKGVRRGAGTIANTLEANRAASPAYADPKRALVEAAQAKDISLPPTQVNPSGINSFLESFAGKVKTGQTLSQKNQPSLRGMAATEAKVPEGVPLTRDALDTSLDREGKAYDAVRDIKGEIPQDATMERTISDLNSPQRVAGEHFNVADDIAPIIEQALPKDGTFTAASALENVKLLRAKGQKAFRDGDDHVGQAYYDAATALEDRIARHAEDPANGIDPAVIENLRQARTNTAKIHDVERALTPGGDVNPQAIAKARDKGAMTGDLALIRDLATEYPKALQNPASFGSVPMGSPLWTRAMSIAKSFMLPEGRAANLPLLGMFVEPVVRSLITSRPYQRLFVQHPGSAGVIERLARSVAPGEPSSELSLAPKGAYIPPAEAAGRRFDAPNPGDRASAVADNLRLAEEPKAVGNEIDIGPFLRERRGAGAQRVESAQAAEEARAADAARAIPYEAPSVPSAVADNLRLGESPRPAAGNEIEMFPFLRERAEALAANVKRNPVADKALAEAKVAAATKPGVSAKQAIEQSTGVTRPAGETPANVQAAMEEPFQRVPEAAAGQVERTMDMGELAKIQDEGRMAAAGEKPRIRTAPREAADRVIGTIYSTPKGPREWTGTGWKKVTGE